MGVRLEMGTEPSVVINEDKRSATITVPTENGYRVYEAEYLRLVEDCDTE